MSVGQPDQTVGIGYGDVRPSAGLSRVAGPGRLPHSRPSELRIEVSGARSSWLTRDRSSSLSCSTARRWLDVAKR